MKRILFLLLLYLGVSGQCINSNVIDTITFESGMPANWNVIPAGDNLWVVNNNYSKGNGNLPGQPNTITSPNGQYAHVSCGNTFCLSLYPNYANIYYDAADNNPTTTYLETAPFTVSGYDSVNISFWTVIKGIANADYGFVEYKLDNGTWTTGITNLSNLDAQWYHKNFTINTQNSNSLTLRFGMRISNNGQGQDPPFSVDEIILTGYSTISVDTSVSYNSTTHTLTANASNATYQWFDCDKNTVIVGETSQSYNPDSSGNFAVIITSQGCTDTSSCYYVDIATTIKYGNNNSVRFYPGVTNDFIFIKGDFNSGRILNILGEQVAIINSGKVRVSQLPSGVYFVEIDRKVVGKFIKK